MLQKLSILHWICFIPLSHSHNPTECNWAVALHTSKSCNFLSQLHQHLLYMQVLDLWLHHIRALPPDTEALCSASFHAGAVFPRGCSLFWNMKMCEAYNSSCEYLPPCSVKKFNIQNTWFKAKCTLRYMAMRQI